MKRIVKLLGLAGWLALPAGPAAAQVLTVLHSFTGGPTDGWNPEGSLILSGSTLYGTTVQGGASGGGTVFSIGASGSGFALLHSFSESLTDGGNPYGSLVQVGSTMYGLTASGGNSGDRGTIFQIGTNGTGFSLLHSFAGGPTDGAIPFGSLALSGTTFYGLTSEGGSVLNTNGNYQNGTVFKINDDGTSYSLLHSFAGSPSDGTAPYYGAPVVSGNTIYGSTAVGGGTSAGVVFKVNTDGTGYSVLHSFAAAAGSDGAGPQAQLILSGSTLYGMTSAGGTAGNRGTIYKTNTDGSGYTILHNFAGAPSDGVAPYGDLTLVGSTLYGTTAGGGADSLGTLFGINTDGSDFQVLHSFTGGPTDGAAPGGDLLLVGSTFYGTTSEGGTSNEGTVFSFTPVPEPSTFGLMAAAALALLGASPRKVRKWFSVRASSPK